MGDSTGDCKLGLLCDSSLAGVLQDSKSSRAEFFVCLLHTLSHRLRGCAKKLPAVSHCSSDSEIISLDAALRMDGLLALQLWERVKHTLSLAEEHEKFHSFSKTIRVCMEQCRSRSTQFPRGLNTTQLHTGRSNDQQRTMPKLETRTNEICCEAL